MCRNLINLQLYINKIIKTKHSYEILIIGAHGSSNCKQLAAQFIPRFFGKFPEYYETALDALFDLCEDTDINVCSIYELDNMVILVLY